MLRVIILFVILIVFSFFLINSEHFANNNNNYNDFIKTLNKYQKKKYILVFTSGPTLKDLKKEHIPKHILDNCYIIAVKNSINYLDKINIKPDFLVSNFIGAAKSLDVKLIDKYKPLFIGLNYGKIKNLQEKTDFMVELDSKTNNMKNVKNDINDVSFKNKNNKLFTGWGHIMMELAIPLCIKLKPEYIITFGWDINNSNKYWNTETFINYWADPNNIINNFSVYLHNYLIKHHNIQIYKFSKKSGIKIPLVNIYRI